MRIGMTTLPLMPEQLPSRDSLRSSFLPSRSRQAQEEEEKADDEQDKATEVKEKAEEQAAKAAEATEKDAEHALHTT